MIKAVLFDASGVLHVANTVVGDDLQQEFGLSDEQVDQVFRKYVPLLGTGKITEREVWQELQRDFGIREVHEDERLFQRSFIATLQKMPGMYELVDKLKQKGITVALLTNVTPQFAAVLEQKGHYDPFDHRILSYEVGLWKPDEAIYQHALKVVGVAPKEAVFIDDQEKNVLAAESLGIHGIAFHDTAQVTRELETLIKSQS